MQDITNKKTLQNSLDVGATNHSLVNLKSHGFLLQRLLLMVENYFYLERK